MKQVPANLDVIIIGSGMGGLSTAALLAKQGKKVLVLDSMILRGVIYIPLQKRGSSLTLGCTILVERLVRRIQV